MNSPKKKAILPSAVLAVALILTLFTAPPTLGTIETCGGPWYNIQCTKCGKCPPSLVLPVPSRHKLYESKRKARLSRVDSIHLL